METFIQRRRFLRNVAGLTAGLTLGARVEAARDEALPVYLFEKPLQSLPAEKMALLLKEWGFSGVEATVRSGGRIDPERAERDLPVLQETLAAKGLRMGIVATDLVSPEDPMARRLLPVFARLGLRYFRLGGWNYDLDREIAPQVKAFQVRAREWAKRTADLGLCCLIQNHAGVRRVGASLWDLAEILEGIDPRHLAVAFDTRHAVVEAGQSWPVGLRRIRHHIGALYPKDFEWDGKRPSNVPLGSGIVGQDPVSTLRGWDWRGPVSLHAPYLTAKDTRDLEATGRALKQELQVFRNWWGG